MTRHYFVGVDGGATKCVVRLEDEAGHLLGYETTGPANIRISVAQAWDSINSALTKILHQNSIPLHDDTHHLHVGMGLAGCEILSAYQAFLNHPHPFSTRLVTSDAHIACLGAHGGEDGAIIITGTGVVGFQIQHGQTTKVSGWGFPHDDIGGGAWIGLQAVKETLQWLDKRKGVSGLVKGVYEYFDNDHGRLVDWANQANSTAFAEIAPIVIRESKNGDEVATAILQDAAQAIDAVGDALTRQSEHKTALPCAMIGGIAPFISPYLGENMQMRLRPCVASPEAGAILFVRKNFRLAGEKS